MDEVPEFPVPVDGMPVVPMEVPVDPALVLPLPAVLLPSGRTTTPPGRPFGTTSEHGAAGSVDSVASGQRLLMRSAPDGLGTGMVWAIAEPASRSAASAES